MSSCCLGQGSIKVHAGWRALTSERAYQIPETVAVMFGGSNISVSLFSLMRTTEWDPRGVHLSNQVNRVARARIPTYLNGRLKSLNGPRALLPVSSVLVDRASAC